MFATDLDNLTLASPQVNRYVKSDKDAADWLPDHNRCWYVKTVLSVKQKYDLTMDEEERNVIRDTLLECRRTKTPRQMLKCGCAGVSAATAQEE